MIKQVRINSNGSMRVTDVTAIDAGGGLTVAVVTTGPSDYADIRWTPDEARQVAGALLQVADGIDQANAGGLDD